MGLPKDQPGPPQTEAPEDWLGPPQTEVREDRPRLYFKLGTE